MEAGVSCLKVIELKGSPYLYIVTLSGIIVIVLMEVGLRIFKHRSFLKWAKSEAITDDSLITAISEMNDGLIDAELGSGLSSGPQK